MGGDDDRDRRETKSNAFLPTIPECAFHGVDIRPDHEECHAEDVQHPEDDDESGDEFSVGVGHEV